MFLNYTKRFFVKKSLNNEWKNLKTDVANTHVQTIGILIDNASIECKDALLKGICEKGIAVDSSFFLVFSESKKQDSEQALCYVGPDDFSWNGKVNSKNIIDFCMNEFDVLLSYYDAANPFLMMITQQSKALFKVGFDAIDPRLNHLLIQTEVTKPEIFVAEVFKYLKLLNKI